MMGGPLRSKIARELPLLTHTALKENEGHPLPLCMSHHT